MKTKLALLVLAWSVTASADERKTLDLSAIASSAPFAVHGDRGLAGLHDHAHVPSNWADREYISSCSRNRHAAVVRPDNMAYEIVSVNGRDFLDTASFTAEADTISITTHERRAVTLVATIGDVNLWAYRDQGSLHIGAFADFGESSRYVSFGCRWSDVMVRERGGVGGLVSAPWMSDPPTYFITQPMPKATGPSFSFAVSVSRSATDAAPLVILRTKDRT